MGHSVVVSPECQNVATSVCHKKRMFKLRRPFSVLNKSTSQLARKRTRIFATKNTYGCYCSPFIWPRDVLPGTLTFVQ